MQGKLQTKNAIFFSTRSFAAVMLAWYRRHRRDLPWRVPMNAARGEKPTPYYVLVSEAMLQQTQVATVIPYFKRFIDRFPTIQALAESDEQEILRLWQGLGYYSRARNLRKAAQLIVQNFKGQLPQELDQLLQLPGIGKYTAGAIGSIAYDGRLPILDGNVARVLCRICAITDDPRDRQTQSLLWSIAEEILPNTHCGDFNQSLMELGATVCTPRNPSCLICPVRKFCRAFDQSIQSEIPLAKMTKPTPKEHRWTFVIEDEAHRLLIEQRPFTGRWAGLWQFVTVEANSAPPRKALHRLVPGARGTLRKLGEVRHQLTHRSYRFEAFHITVKGFDSMSRKWVSREDLAMYPMSKPQLKIFEMVREMDNK